MTSIIKKSGILSWTIDSIEVAPQEKGVYVMRNLPTQNGIIYIGYTDNLRQELKQMWETKQIIDVVWFDWYQVNTKEKGEEILGKWIEKYSPKYNLL